MMEGLILTALRFEAKALSSLAAAPTWRVAATGVGPVKACTGALASIRAVQPRFIVGIGLCGALNVTTFRNEIVVPDELASDDADTVFHTANLPTKWIEQVGKQGRRVTVGGRMLSSETVAGTIVAKRGLREQFQADWVDQESHTWAKCANESGIPFYAIRVVLDDATNALPSVGDMTTWASALTLPTRALAARRVIADVGRVLLCVPW